MVRNCIADYGSFCGGGAEASPITGATGTDASESVISKANGFTAWYAPNNKVWGQYHEHPGSIVYLTGTNVTAGWYEVKTFDSDDELTLTSNASSGGAMSNISLYQLNPSISGTLDNCIVTADDGGAGLASFAQGGTARCRITGVVRNCLNGANSTLTAGNNNSGALGSFSGVISGCAPQTAKACTTATTVHEFDNGQMYANTGASGAVVITLCAAKAGLTYSFADVVDTAAVDLTISAAGGDDIVGDADESLVADDDATQIICLSCYSEGKWLVTNSTGTWD